MDHPAIVVGLEIQPDGGYPIHQSCTRASHPCDHPWLEAGNRRKNLANPCMALPGRTLKLGRSRIPLGKPSTPSPSDPGRELHGFRAIITPGARMEFPDLRFRQWGTLDPSPRPARARFGRAAR
jgi:hypothetical protein